MEGKFLDNIFSTFELDLPHLDSMEAYIAFILPKVKEYGGSFKNTNLWQGARWMEIQGTDAWDKSFIHIFMPENEYLIFDNGVMSKRSWRILGNSLLIDEGRATILYEVDYIDSNFFILRQNGTNRYFVLGKEGFVRKIKQDWRVAMEELYNEYRNNSKFSLWVMVLILALVLILGYFYM
ncbi:MAG: hypothetical protein JNL70_18140 [Saprospiraceae bacterium]|nr:hypothetical protein [Saprospiraceae bacterium]